LRPAKYKCGLRANLDNCILPLNKESKSPNRFVLPRLSIERILHFDFNTDFVKDGLAHFGFHNPEGDFYALDHKRHYMGLVGKEGQLEWTVAREQVFPGIPNIRAQLDFPIFVDRFDDGTLVVSNFGDSQLYRIYPDLMKSELLVDGAALGIRHAGNCVIDGDGCIWLNEVEGCRVRRFDQAGKLLATLGTGEPGFQSRSVQFGEAMFNWVYDMRKGPDGNMYVLDSRNFAVRVIDIGVSRVLAIAGMGKPGYSGDGGDPLQATFGGDPSARFDGPISLSLDEEGNVFVGDRFNRVVRVIEKRSDTIRTIAGDTTFRGEARNDTNEADLFRLRLPKISSMDYHDHRLFVPTDLTEQSGDLVVLSGAT